MSGQDDQDRDVREQYLAWKRLVPYLYDSFINHHLTWPSLSCRWGPLVHETHTRRKQRLYLSDQTDGSEPNKLVLVTAEVAKPRLSSSEAVSSFSEQARSPHISGPLKTLVHPGEVNKLLDIPQYPSLVVTHSDTPDVYVWNFDAQPDRGGALAARTYDSRNPSVADAILKGHEANAEFALGTSNVEPLVASGGKDTNVLVWSLEDASTCLTAISSPGKSPEINPRNTQKGHFKTVEDVAFRPGSKDELMSVADDYSILFWDLRAGQQPVGRVSRAHGERDVHCCDWSPHKPMHVVTGAQDGGVRVWDKRNLGGALVTLNHHTDAVMNVEWSPHREGMFATGADDGLVCLWDLDANTIDGEGPGAAKRAKVAAPPQLLFQHAGHQSPVVDFCWNPLDPWTLLSASVDVASSGGGTLQLWRVSDMIYRSEEEIMNELEPYKEYIVTGDEEKLELVKYPGKAAKKQEDAGLAMAVMKDEPGAVTARAEAAAAPSGGDLTDAS
ncbi:hypothetical protein Ndes2437B_g05480 [Nannochloris sp. 'desiccata']|nr:hypothetical protein KSW81_007490 [Chlorella desiccata (nom. nud.)]